MLILTSNLKYIIEVPDTGGSKRFWPVKLYQLWKKAINALNSPDKKEYEKYFSLFEEENKNFFNNEEKYTQYLKDRDYYLCKDKE